jgi:hypothetical protein
MSGHAPKSLRSSTESETNGRPNVLRERGMGPTSPSPLEPFVDAKTVSAFLAVSRADVLRMTRDSKIRGYAYKGQLRHVYRYRLSEVSADFEGFASHKRTISEVAPVSRRRETSNG